MLLDDRYPVLETLESRDGVTLYRVEGGLVFYFDVRTPQDKDRFYRYRAAIRPSRGGTTPSFPSGP